jgi:uncharacterized membrane protein YeiH
MFVAEAATALHVPIAIDLAAVIVGALSGGSLAAREGFAVTGVLLLSFSTGLGGGLIRDVLLARGTPVALTDRAYLPTVAIAAVITFFFAGVISRLNGVMITLDALTLGLFTVIGAEKAQLAGLPGASVVFLGVVTAVGGGIIRDILLGQVPDIAKPGPINAAAALIGASLVPLLAGPFEVPRIPADLIVITVVSVLRLLAVWRGWEAPVPVDLTPRLRPVRTGWRSFMMRGPRPRRM